MAMAGRIVSFALVIVGLGAVVSTLALVGQHGRVSPSGAARAAWAELRWPFPMDQWGRGKAFRCGARDCGAEINLYLRAKLGFCDCSTGVANDDDLDRMSDFDLAGGEVSPLGAGRPIMVGSMKGRSRAYAIAAAHNAPHQTALAVAFNDRCDMVSAIAVVSHQEPRTAEPLVMEFLNGTTVLRWVETTLGL